MLLAGHYWLNEASRLLIESMLLFHDSMMIWLLSILGVVAWIFIFVLSETKLNKYVIDLHALELFWTILPIVVLLLIAYPSLYLLYLTESVPSTRITAKVVAHQWYWEYQVDTLNTTTSANRYITAGGDGIRNIDVDNRLIVASGLNSLLLVTSADVLHCFTVPALGVKVDAVPGRLNYLTLSPVSRGLFYGQCSELCGRNHRYMPIVVEAVAPIDVVSRLGGLRE